MLKTFKYKSRMIILIGGIAFLVFGYSIGRLLGYQFVENLILAENRLPLIISRPVSQFYEVYGLINSDNPLSRLSGYYSLNDNKMINIQFLIERYRKEDIIALKRTLLWLMSFSGETDKVLKFYESIYATSDNSIKIDLLKMMKHVDNSFYHIFIKKNKIGKEYIYD